MLKYKLVVVRDETPDHKIPSYREEFTIGYFESEEELSEWAAQNQGELPKNE